jgi:transposase
MARRKHSDEYKGGAVELTRAPGVKIQQVARDLGINAYMLGRWRMAIEHHGEEAFPGQGQVRDEELVRLKRGQARVKKERDV